MYRDDMLTKYEVTRIISARALQISLGAPIFIKTEKFEPREIAIEEFKRKLIPITIKRKFPNGEIQIVKIKKAIENYLKINKL